MGAPHVVGEDFEAGDGGGTCTFAEEEGVHGEVGVGALRAVVYLDDALEAEAGSVSESALEEDVSEGIDGGVVGVGGVVEVLVAIGEADAAGEGAGASAEELCLGVGFDQLGAYL